MCHLYHLRINTHVVTLYHALHHRATITARSTGERGEMRAKYMCRLVRQLKNRDRTQPTKDEWNELKSPTDTSMGSGSNLDDLTESVM